MLIIDGQGGGLGRQLVASIKSSGLKAELWAVGTNSQATAAMMKAGADVGATGENAVVACCRKADVILGPLGIALADALYGEITPAMAVAVGQSPAQRLLIPLNHCDTMVVGLADQSIARLVNCATAELLKLAQG